MTSTEACNQYAAEMAQRFEDFTKWAIENWPAQDFPLLQSDFIESRKEIQQILGAKLSDSQHDQNMQSKKQNSVQYVNMNPSPWP